MSAVSTSPELSNREVFRFYFQLLPPDDDLAIGFFTIIRRYGWKRVAIIQQDENIFTLVSMSLGLPFSLKLSHNIYALLKCTHTLECIQASWYSYMVHSSICVCYYVIAKFILCTSLYRILISSHCQTMDRLKVLLDVVNVSYSETSFKTKEGVAGLGSNNLFVSECMAIEQ